MCTSSACRDSLGALAGAIKEFGGGVVIISHHNEFTTALCPEKWTVANGKCEVTGAPQVGVVCSQVSTFAKVMSTSLIQSRLSNTS